MCVPVSLCVCLYLCVCACFSVCLCLCLYDIWNAKSTPAPLSLSVSPINTAKARGRIAQSPQYHKRILITHHGHAHNAHMTFHHDHNSRNYCLLVCACACILLLLPTASAQGYCDPSLCPGGARHVVCGNSGVSSDTIAGSGQGKKHLLPQSSQRVLTEFNSMFIASRNHTKQTTSVKTCRNKREYHRHVNELPCNNSNIPC